MNIVGITACMTGLAHTYMAQEALLKEGRKRGHNVRIETQGAMGPEDELEDEELEQADCAVIAVDTVAEGMERLEDIPLLEVTVAKAVHHPEAVFDELEAMMKGA